MGTVRRSTTEIRKGRGRVQLMRIAAFTDAAIERFAREDDSDTRGLGTPRYVPPSTDVRALRVRLGLSQDAFARRYMLPLRTIQDWEQHRREPSDAARVLLFAISRHPKAVEKALRG
jgi:DNA-binding transcriptional regulator YiaG